MRLFKDLLELINIPLQLNDPHGILNNPKFSTNNHKTSIKYCNGIPLQPEQMDKLPQNFYKLIET